MRAPALRRGRRSSALFRRGSADAAVPRRPLTLRARIVYEILSMYESSFAKITDKYFKASSWPPVEAIAQYVDYDHVFCMLYK